MVSKVWEGQTVVCIASGPSLTQADCDLVRRSGLPTVAVNSSWRMARFADVIYAGDAAWWDAYGDEVTIPAERWTCTRLAAQKHGINLHVAYGPYNSGSRAIQFALERGAARVILLGYDCSVEDGSHWHGDHERTKNPTPDRVRLWHRQFAAVALQAKVRKAQVVNCSRKTALTAFPRGDLVQELGKKTGRPVVVEGMFGLGDSIYQRAFLKNMPGAYIVTPWPELYADLDVKPVRPQTRLRTQAKNAARTRIRWHTPPADVTRVRIGYGSRDLATGSILDAMRRQFGSDPGRFDLPREKSPLRVNRPVAIVRPVTERAEWHNSARNPLPEYVTCAARELKRRGYYVVSVADLEPGKEWLVGQPPPADMTLHAGQWTVRQLLGAVQGADVVVGGVGWIVPACIAAGTPLYVIHGGQGGHNHRSKITAPWMDLTKVGWAEPATMCMCTDMRHNCNKEIHGFDAGFRAWLDGQGLFGSGMPRTRLAA